MPIEIQSDIRVFEQEEFHSLTRRVLRLAFDVHNDFGRFLDEELCKRELATRCIDAGIIPVQWEVRIRLVHKDFWKDYFMDLLLAEGLMVEAKAADCLVPAHHGQAVNYLLLAGIQHGLLVNFRAARVEHRFVSTKLTQTRRRQFQVDASRWMFVNPEADWLQDCMLQLLKDWGAFLEVTLYRDAIIHFLGGPDTVCHPVDIVSGKHVLGTQDLFLLTHNAAFSISAITSNPEEYESHMSRFLNHTRLDCIHWINLNHHNISFVTLVNSSNISSPISFLP
jgi:GxxExxY protein